jgi:hypothetical protein
MEESIKINLPLLSSMDAFHVGMWPAILSTNGCRSVFDSLKKGDSGSLGIELGSA